MADTPQTPSKPKLHGADTAPIVDFDNVPIWGVSQVGGRLLLEALVSDEDETGKPTYRRRAVLHLRGNQHAFEELRRAVDGVLLMLAKPAGGEN